MKVVLATDYGFCFGVKKAVDRLRKGLKNWEIHTDGDIVHNRRVMESLVKDGLKIVENGKGEIFAIRAHGIPPKKAEEISKRYNKLMDLTCPIVKSLFEKALSCRERGYGVVVFGKEGHAEMIALKGYVPDAIVTSEAQFYGMENICVLSQTTASWQEFSEFISELVRLNFPSKKISIINTACPVTVNREDEVGRLSEKCDLIVVVGGKHSANTGKLYRIASRKTRAVWIESPDEAEGIDLDEMECVAIVSGTSTPARDVEEVYDKILRRGKYGETRRDKYGRGS